MIAACAAFGANAPNGAGEGSLSGVKRWSSMSGACIAGFKRDSNEALSRLVVPCWPSYLAKAFADNDGGVGLRKYYAAFLAALGLRRKRPSRRRPPLRGIRSTSLTDRKSVG